MDSENNKNQRSYEKKQSNDAIGTAERVHPDAHPSEALSSDAEVKKAQHKINADIGENQRSDHGKTRKATEMNDRDRIKVVHRVRCVKPNDIIHYNNHLSDAQGFITAEEREHSCYIYLYAKKPGGDNDTISRLSHWI